MKRLLGTSVLLSFALVACPQPAAPIVQPSPILEQPFKPVLLGSLTVQLGGEPNLNSAKFVPVGLTNQALTQIPDGALAFTALPSATFDANVNERFIVAPFKVTNTTNAALSNITLVAYSKNGNVGGSAFKDIQSFVGVNTPVDVNTLKPIHAMTGNGSVVVDNDNADLQIFKRSEITTLTNNSAALLSNGEGILHYGFIARKGNSGTYRTIPGTTCGAAPCNEGRISLALKVPKDSDAGSSGSVYRYSMTFLIFADSVSRVTESLEELGTTNAATRVTALTGGATIASMCGTSQTTSTFIPGVRTVGVGVDTAWMGGNFFDNTETAANFTGIIGNTEKAYTAANATLTARFTALGGATLTPQNRAIASATTTKGGNLGIDNSATGTVTIRPKVNWRVADGADDFTYQISDGTCISPDFNATVAAPTNTVWHIDPSAPAGGDGRSNARFRGLLNLNVVANPNTVTANNDFIYVYQNITDPETLTMKPGQQLIGAGVALVVGGEEIIAVDISSTLLTPIVLNSTGGNNTIRGLTVRSVTGTNFGTLTMNNASIAAISTQAINLTNGVLAVTLTSVSSSGGTNGIKLTNTTGSLSVTGDGTIAESGGILTGHTADGINLATQFGTISLKNMRISNSANQGVDATPSTGTNSLKLEDVTINNVSTVTPATHNAIFYNASGTSSNTLEVLGTVPLTLGNQNTVAARIDTGDTTGVFVGTVSGSTASMVLNVNKVSFRENATFGIATQFQANSATTTTIDNNRIFMTSTDGSGVRYDADTPTQTHKLRISRNFIDLKETANTGAGVGIDIRARQNATLETVIDSNTIRDNESNGILLFAGTASTATSTNVQATISNNTISSPTTTSGLQIAGINVQSGVSGGSGVVTCLRIIGNDSTITEPLAFNYNLRRISVTSNIFNLHGAGALLNAAAISSYLLGTPQSNFPNDPAKVQVLGAASSGYGTCTVVTPTFL
jgi:trimeric autotransporter adhesin